MINILIFNIEWLNTKNKKNAKPFVSDSITIETTESNYAFADESLNLLYDAIRKLSEIDRAVIMLYLEEKSQKEIAEIIGTNPNNIGVRVNRIKIRLKKILDGKINWKYMERGFS